MTFILNHLAPALQAPNYGPPPRPVLIALTTLLGPEPQLPDAACASVWIREEAGQKSTTWQVVALTDSHVVMVTAVRETEMWALNFGDQRPEWLRSWRAPVSAIARVGVTDVDLWDTHQGEDWLATLTYELVLADGERVTFPGPEGSSYDDAAADRLAEELLRQT